MTKRFASGKYALGVCDRCGFQFKLSELRTEVVRGRITNVRVCKPCWDPDHPQNELGKYPVNDPQALRDSRPDSPSFAASRARILQVRGLNSTVQLGFVSVST